MPRITEQCVQTIADLYRSGLSTNEVSKQVGVSQSSVSRVLQRCGIITRPMSSYKSSSRFPTEKELQIIDLYVNQGQTTLSIAKRFHTYNTSIRRVLLRYGITPRSNQALQQTVSLSVYRQEHILKIYNNLYTKAHFFLKRKKKKFGPLLRKLSSEYSVNSGKELVLFNPEPSHSSNAVEGVET